MRFKKALKLGIPALLLLGSISIIGCSRPILIHPIEKSDIFSIPIGTKIGAITTEKNGWFLSDLYVEEVMKAKVE
jgi:hypothetical protein